MSRTSRGSDTSLKLQPIRYRNWLISTKLINQRLWLRWQHPKEAYPRYSYPVTEGGLTDTIRYARMMIDLSIQLEEGATQLEYGSSQRQTRRRYGLTK
ncbi:hypothetical protein [Lyngbya aestuarii]|uniref:hypothetical protein n=1 Tax=Lyngbya aestuarii TaxID=118322 RepID=UPI00403DBC1E